MDRGFATDDPEQPPTAHFRAVSDLLRVGYDNSLVHPQSPLTAVVHDFPRDLNLCLLEHDGQKDHNEDHNLVRCRSVVRFVSVRRILRKALQY